ncbi:MAG: TolC family protein [Gemmatimonadales bacterium]
MTWRPVVMALGAMLGAGAVQAQQVPQRLTLEDALEIARERNPAYRKAIVQADASGADVTAGVGQFLPNVNGSLNFNGSTRTVFTGTDDFGRAVETQTSRTFRSSSSSQGVTSNLTLFDGLQNVNNLRAARAGARATRAGVGVEAARMEADVKRRFYGLVQAQDLVAIEERMLAARNRELSATERLFRVASRTQVDVLGAQVSVSRQEAALETARGTARKNRLLLAEGIGLEGGVSFEAQGTLPEVFDPSLLDADELVTYALQHNPRVEQAIANVRQQDFAASAARGQRWPTLGANVGFNRSLSQDGYGGLFELDPRDRAFSFGFSVSIPVFTRFQTSQAIARASANEHAADEDLRAVRLEVERMVRSAVIDVENSYRQVQLADRSAELGRQRLAMAQQQYQVGSIDFTQLQQIVTTSASDERDALTARLNWANALTALEELVRRTVTP